MDVGSLASRGVESAATPLGSLAATVGGVLLAALLSVLAMHWRARRRHAEPVRGAGDGSAVDAATPARETPAPGLDAGSYLRLAAVAILAVFLLPAAAAVRQLWPHPDLGWPMIAGWSAVLAAVVAAWLALAGSAASASTGDVPAQGPRS